jgi:hypothetical protein
MEGCVVEVAWVGNCEPREWEMQTWDDESLSWEGGRRQSFMSSGGQEGQASVA